ncbi:MAG: 1,6-anhydro-N-acetylmuramyl-L-alanine amidase AmpD [Gammaproteobacteria bacterium]
MHGWLRGARHCPSPNCDDRPPGLTPELIVIHAISLPPGEFGTGCPEALFTNTLDCSAHPYFAALETLRVSAHFLVARDGALTQFVAVDQRAWHAGQSSWAGRTACNDFSIGIELEGCDEQPFTAGQYGALAGLLAALRAVVPALDASRVVGHCDIAPGRKTDPGPCFDWTRVRAALAS